MKRSCGKSLIGRLFARLCKRGCSGCSGGGCCSCHACEPRKACSGIVTLDALDIGQQGEVTEVAGGNQDMVNRFADHGLVRGIVVSVHEQALFGGPMLVSVQGTMVALRRREAQLIRVRVLSA